MNSKENFARKELGNADSEVLSEYRSLLNQYDLTISWTAQQIRHSTCP